MAEVNTKGAATAIRDAIEAHARVVAAAKAAAVELRTPAPPADKAAKS